MRMILNKLGSAKSGDELEICGFDTQVPLERSDFLHRMAEVGFLTGEVIEVLAEAPFSRDPISVRVKQATYALRREDANLIWVKKRT